MSLTERIKNTVREVPDFPKPGINFKDITTILEDPVLSKDIILHMKQYCETIGVDAVLGVESRGFLFGMMLASELQVPFVTVRKKGKLPYKTINYKYNLEYGSAEVEMHVDSIKPGWKVLVHDDLLATGGTAAAAAELVKMQNGEVAGFTFVIELSFLKGVDRLQKYSNNILNLASY